MTTTDRSSDDLAPGDPDTSVSVLDDTECLRLLGTRRHGRLIIGAGDRSVDETAGCLLDGTDLVVGTGTRVALDVLPLSEVSFEVDDRDPRTGTGWTVRVHGRAERSSGDRRAASAGPRAPVLPAPRLPDDELRRLRLTPHTISGRRISARPGAEWSWGIGALM